RYSLAQRVQALTLLSEGYKTAVVAQKTGIPARTYNNIRKKAKERGFDPIKDTRILKHYVEDGFKPGRPKEVTKEQEEELLALIRKDRAGREKSSEYLAYEIGLSRSTALRLLHTYNLSCVKPTRKPGLTAIQKRHDYTGLWNIKI